MFSMASYLLLLDLNFSFSAFSFLFFSRIFAFNDYFKNRFLPDNNYTFEKTLPSDIVEAKQLINQFRAEGDDEKVKIVKQRLIDAGYDIRDYNL